MTNKKVIDYYNKMAEKISNPKETRNKAKDFSMYDIAFMKKYASSKKTLLDLGSGTGLLINYLIDDFAKIIAVEKYSKFSDFITKCSKIQILNQDLLELNIENSIADIVSLFGVMNYFNVKEATIIYKKSFNSLKEDGLLIIKNQMGIYEDVTVNGFSDELQTNYYSNYRYINKEIKLVESLGFTFIQKINIYPKEYNRWENTHFYALVFKKRLQTD